LHQKRLGSLQTILVASPGYLASNSAPQSLDELDKHRLIGTNTLTSWRMSNIDNGKECDVRPRFSTLVNDVKLVTQLVCDDLGISLLPTSEVNHLIHRGDLVQILTSWQGPNRDLFTVWPSGKLLSARAKCLRDFMHAYFEKHDHA